MPSVQHRVHVSTDLGGDPDDIQALFRLVHDLPPAECQATMSRWRVDCLSHWRDRWDRYGG